MSVITERHLFGWSQEERLLKYFNKHLGESFERTKKRYDSLDGLGAVAVYELKSRPKTRWNRFTRTQVPVDSKSYPDGWLMPCCKMENLPAGKKLYFFYYYEGDDTLWVCPYEEAKFSELNPFYPSYNPTQKHILIPVEWWSQVDCYRAE